MGDMEDVLKEFLVETHENIDRLERDFVTLERDPGDRESLASVFRVIHSIKGASGCLGLSRLEALAHAGENLLTLLRDGTLSLNQTTTDALLSLVDLIRSILASLEAGKGDSGIDCAQIIGTLNGLSEGKGIRPKDTRIGRSAESASEQEGTQGSERIASRVEQKASDTSTRINDTAISRPEPSVAEREGAKSLEHVSSRVEQKVSDTTIRVDVGLLDKLMNLVGELVLARNQVLQFGTTQADSSFLATCQRLDLLTTELQEGVMKTRMQPIGNIWGKFPRLVRDMALATGKQVRIEMEGSETDLDKSLIEAITDPLTHLVRNAIDHGVETPEARRSTGKPEVGRIVLRAFHEGGQVNIEVSDDGAGMDPERIRSKAIQGGFINAEQASRMSDRQSLKMVFLPGFSTTEVVTSLSGRGVGMDVVKTNVEKVGGVVDIQSTPGQGVVVRMKIPLTLAIIPALIVTSGGERFAIPQVSLLELVRVRADQKRGGLEYIHGTPVYRLRGNLLPLIYLNRELQLETEGAAAHGKSMESGSLSIVVVQSDDRPFGLVVDSINDTEEIVVKSIAKQMMGASVFAGATIMGDGKVALILDVLGLAQRSSVVSEARERILAEKVSEKPESVENKESLLLLKVGDRRIAIPVAMVARLEEVESTSIEKAADQEVVQYRGQILPLIRLRHSLGLNGSSSAEERSSMQVVVYADKGRSVGLVVDRILDIVEQSVSVKRKIRAQGINGTAVIQNRVTDLLDVESVVREADPAFFETSLEARS
jgi:two-component system chemotaxis sensor kinase CheA